MNLSRYGWLHVVESLSDRDITKWDAVIRKRASEVFTHLTYMKDYYQYQKQMMRRQQHD